MTIKTIKDKAALRKSKQKTIKLGRRSINDIIKSRSLSFPEKIDYIRHHYTYYEGNANLFDNQYEYRRSWLNKLIEGVINGKYQPCVLKSFNRIIMKWRKNPNYKPKQSEIHTEKRYADLCNSIDFFDLIELQNYISNDNKENSQENVIAL